MSNAVIQCLSYRVFGHFEKPLFIELCKHMETKFIPAGAILFRPGQVCLSTYYSVVIFMHAYAH